MHDLGILVEIGPWLYRLEQSTGLPRKAVAAVLVLLVGWASALLLRLLVRKLVLRVEQLLPSSDKAEVDGVVGRNRAAHIISRAVFWIVLLVFVMAATELLGLQVVTQWLSGVTSFLPRLLLAFVVAALGVVVGRAAGRAVRRAAGTAGLDYAGRLGRLVQAVIVLASVLVAAEQLGLQVQFVTTALMIALAALMGGAALAFGLGGRPVVANILASHYVRKLYEVGQVIRIDGVQGRILRITPTAVILEAEDGETAVPTRELIVVRSTLVARGDL